MTKSSAMYRGKVAREGPPSSSEVRAFKERRFAKDAKAAGIGDAELCEAVCELEKDREDIAPDELVGFKKLARDYAAAKRKVWESMLDSGDLKEICNDEKDKEGTFA